MERARQVEVAVLAMVRLTPAERDVVVQSLPVSPVDCKAPCGCPNPAEQWRPYCSGHRKRLQRTGQLGGQLRAYTRRTTLSGRRTATAGGVP